MKDKNKAVVILDFICAAGWLACLIFDIVEKDFSFQFYCHILLIIVSIINACLFLKNKLPKEQDDYLDDYIENRKSKE